jgi:hypothetical protein
MLARYPLVGMPERLRNDRHRHGQALFLNNGVAAVWNYRAARRASIPAAKPHCQSDGGRTAQRRHTIPPETMMNCQGRQFSNPASSGKRAWTIGILLRSRMPRRGS